MNGWHFSEPYSAIELLGDAIDASQWNCRHAPCIYFLSLRKQRRWNRWGWGSSKNYHRFLWTYSRLLTASPHQRKWKKLTAFGKLCRSGTNKLSTFAVQAARYVLIVGCTVVFARMYNRWYHAALKSVSVVSLTMPTWTQHSRSRQLSCLQIKFTITPENYPEKHTYLAVKCGCTELQHFKIFWGDRFRVKASLSSVFFELSPFLSSCQSGVFLLRFLDSSPSPFWQSWPMAERTVRIEGEIIACSPT